MRGLGILAAGAAVLALAGSGPVAAETVTVSPGPTLAAELTISPKTLPKRTAGAAALSFETRFPTTTASGAPVSAVREVVLRLDRNIVLNFRGYPSCKADLERNDIDQIEALCKDAIVGAGKAEFESAVVSRRPGTLLPETVVLNGGRRGDVRTLYVVKRVVVPVVAMVVMPIRIGSVDEGRFGREATISIPPGAAETVGPLTALRLKIDKKFIRDGRKASVVSARCPDGKLMLSTSVEFADGTRWGEDLVRSCTGRAE